MTRPLWMVVLLLFAAMRGLPSAHAQAPEPVVRVTTTVEPEEPRLGERTTVLVRSRTHQTESWS